MEGENILEIFEKQRKKDLAVCEKVQDDVYVSRFEGLNLQQYIDARSLFCKKKHAQTCIECNLLISVAQHILENGFILLKQAFEMCSPGVTYTSSHARRKLLQMPLAAIGVGLKSAGTYCLYVVERQSSVNHVVLQTLLNKVVQSNRHNKEAMVSRDEMKSLLNLAESESEKERLKYLVVRSSGMSAEKAQKIYGFHNVHKRAESVQAAYEEADAIKETILKIASVKDKALLDTLGVSDADSVSEDEISDSEVDTDHEEDDSNSNGGDVNEGGVLPHQLELSEYVNDGECYKHVTETGDISMNSHQLQDILRKCSFNWFRFVNVVKEMLHDSTLEAVEKLLLDFAAQIPFLGLNLEEERLIEHSRQAYLCVKRSCQREQDAQNGEVVSDSDASETELWQNGISDVLGEDGRLMIEKKRASLHRKAVRESRRKVMERRFLKRRRSKKVGRILQDCPGIGAAVEEFVAQCGAGADAWRRTGVVTFDGNKKVQKKATFRRIKEFLENKYNRRFAYGTVVQLCVARNKRRRSAMRYQGVANVVHKRARKGFNIRFNPDHHWSAAFYSALNKIQYTDGTNIMNLGRDDQAGFRLDTMATHKSHATLCISGKESLTTRTDYVNSYPSVLQTTSYNFPATAKTGEICAGVVKAPGLFEKGPPQHMADLKMVEKQEAVQRAFVDTKTGDMKEVECVRVDGSFDEGPSHLEVQYWWTLRHLERGSKAIMVTSRNSGASYLNRVELQNGCLALAHANLFIPSTMHGSCRSTSGQVDQEVLKRNLDSAIDVYLERVDGAPCAGTQIHLFKGADSTSERCESELLKVFLKGSKGAKKKLKADHLDMYEKFERVWTLRENHLVDRSLPQKYVFFLACCYQPGCIHPVCREKSKESEPLWYPGGPHLRYVPIPTPDTDRPNGGQCQDCEGVCSGHYLKPDKLWQHANSGGELGKPQPPSDVIFAVYREHKSVPSEAVIQQVARSVLLSCEEVKFWFDHLHQTHENRRKGAQKAAQTRREKAQGQSNRGKSSRKQNRKTNKGKQRQTSSNVGDENDNDENVLCVVCELHDPLQSARDDMVSWVQCDGCLSWCHISCAELEEDNVPDRWLCLRCSEVW